MIRKFAAVFGAVMLTSGLSTTTVPAAETHSLRAPVVLSIVVTPKLVPAAGGRAIINVKVAGARTCGFGIGRAQELTEKCADGLAAAAFTVPATDLGARQVIPVWVQAAGPGGRSARRQITIRQAGVPTTCTAPCTFKFPPYNEQGIASVAVNGVAQAVAWPGPSTSNDVPAGDQLDLVNLTICTGATNANTSGEPLNFVSITLSGSEQGTTDEGGMAYVTAPFDNAIEVDAGTCLAAQIYYDVPVGVAWTAVDFTYSSGDPHIVYTWTPPK